MFNTINRLLNDIQRTKPLVLNVTNQVTMEFIANGLLCTGASPVMSQSKQDIEALMRMSSSVVINIGTLDDAFISLCEHTCKIANTQNVPIVFDPVGAGATRYRTAACQRLLEQFDLSIVRGNASEIMALAGFDSSTKGVDSMVQTHSAIEAAVSISQKMGAAVVVSGAQDVIIEGDNITTLTCGSPIMPLVVGTGCLLSAVVGAFHAVEPNRFIAAHAATLFYGTCGEQAASKARFPGSFKTAFLDALYDKAVSVLDMGGSDAND